MYIQDQMMLAAQRRWEQEENLRRLSKSFAEAFDNWMKVHPDYREKAFWMCMQIAMSKSGFNER